MLGRRLLYLVWSLLLCQCCSRFSIYKDGLLVQVTVHLLSGENRWVTFVVSHEFSPYTPMALMACVKNGVCSLPVHMLRVQGWVGIAVTCWVSWWLGVRGSTISIRGRDGTQCIGWKWSDYGMLSLPVWQNLSNLCVVAPVVTLCLIIQNIVLGPLILHFPWCVTLVLIPTLSICHGFLLCHSVYRVMLCSWVVLLGCCLNHSVRPTVCSCFLCMIALEILQ